MSKGTSDRSVRRADVLRRTVLKSGSALVGAGLITGGGAARGATEYVGYAYDPKTKEIQGRATARLTEAYDDLVGTLDVNGLRIPVNQKANSKVEVPSADGPRPAGRFDFEKGTSFKRHGHDLGVQIMATPNYNVAGVAEYTLGGGPDDRSDISSAFVVKPKTSGRTEQEILDIIGTEVLGGGKR